MKTRTLILVIIFLSIVSFFTAEDIMAEVSIEDLQGIWTNPFYLTNWDNPEKIVIDSDKRITLYRMGHAEHMIYQGSFDIKESWSDQEGNNWYKILFPEVRGEHRYELWRFSNSNTIWESVSGKQSFPTEINSGESSYLIHYRRFNYTDDNMELWDNLN